MYTPFSQLNDDLKKELSQLVSAYGSVPVIKTYMYQRHQIRLNNSAVEAARNEFIIQSLKDIGIDPTGSACDKLLSFFRLRDDVSFIAITHTISSGYVTMTKSSQKVNTVESPNKGDDCIYHDEVLSWRNSLKIADGTRILVAVAWMHNSNQRNIKMYPEFFSVDVTFGVCREQRNLLRFCGVDGQFKVFEAMNCFMPSKQYKAYEWAVSVAFPKLAPSTSLSYTSMITSDQEDNLVRSIGKLTSGNKFGRTYCQHAKHRLDMYHIFIKEWKNKVSTKMFSQNVTFDQSKYSFCLVILLKLINKIDYGDQSK